MGVKRHQYRRQPFKMVNVCDPRPVHMLRLRCGQDIRLRLHDVSRYKYPDDCEWLIDVKGFLELYSNDYLTINGDVINEFIIVQTKDVKPHWQSSSNCFLGSVRISVRSTETGGVNLHSILSVYLDCDVESKKSIATIIQPVEDVENQQSIIISPRQSLQVVIPDLPYVQMDWRFYIFRFNENTNIHEMKQVGYEYLPVGCNIVLSNDKRFLCERYVYPDTLEDVCPLYGEHHYFFQFDDVDLMLDKLEPDQYPAFKFVMIGKSIDDYICVKHHKFDLYLRVRNKDKGHVDNSKKLDSSRFLDRVVIASENTLINPDKTEQITFTNENQDGKYLIEIVEPSVYFSTKAESLYSASWQAKVEPIHLKSADKYRSIQLVQVEDRYVESVRYQRFVISIKGNEKIDVVNEVILGKVVLFCDAIKHCVPAHERQLFILLNKNGCCREITLGSSTYKVHSSVGNSSKSIYKPSSSSSSRKKRNRYYDYDYYDVEIFDVLGDITSGEVVTECMVDTRPYHDYDDEASHYNNSDKYNSDFERDIERKKKDTKGRSKENTNNNWTDSGGSSLKTKESLKSAISIIKNNREKKTDTLIPNIDLEPYCIYNPRSNQIVTIERGKKIIIRLLLPKGEFKNTKLRKQWGVNVINTKLDDGYSLWISYSHICESPETSLPYQEIEILPLLTADFKKVKRDVFQIGIIRIQCDNIVKHIAVHIDEREKGEKLDSLSAHLDYYKSLDKSQVFKTGSPFQHRYSTIKNRTTLVNPIEETVDIPVCDQHDIEIILLGGQNDLWKWRVTSHVLGGGSIRYLDNSIYTIWNGAQVHRTLLRCIQNPEQDSFFGEVKISYDGRDTGTRIRPYKERAKPSKFVPDDDGTLYILGMNADNSRKVKIKNWHNNDLITIHPDQHVHIEVPNVYDVFADNYKNIVFTRGSWDIKLTEISLERAVYDLIPEDLRDEIDRLTPYYNHHFIFHPAEIPWEFSEFTLQPLSITQPLIYEILDAMNEYYNQKYFQIAELDFEFNVDGFFIFKQTLRIRVENINYQPSR